MEGRINSPKIFLDGKRSQLQDSVVRQNEAMAERGEEFYLRRKSTAVTFRAEVWSPPGTSPPSTGHTENRYVHSCPCVLEAAAQKQAEKQTGQGIS